MQMAPQFSRNVIVSSIGAGIVLLTFIANEGIRDTFKERAEGLESQFNTLTLRKGIMAAEERRGVAEDKILRQSSMDAEQQAFDQFLRDTREIDTSLEFIKDAAAAASLRTLLQQVGPANVRLEQLTTTLIKTHVSYVAAAKDTLKSLQLVPSETATMIDIGTLQSDVANLVQQGLKGVEAEKLKAEGQYQAWKKTSYVLYFLGWLINLLGRLFKINGLAMDGE